MHNPDQITHNGKKLSDILADHKKWLINEAGGIRANLSSANLFEANLWGANLFEANLFEANLSSANLSSANLSSANLWGAVGNMAEVKSLQIEKWTVTYTTEVMQIGCQRHPIEMWRKSDPRWIAVMDSAATEWWATFGPLILAIIDASPAVATGNKVSSHV